MSLLESILSQKAKGLLFKMNVHEWNEYVESKLIVKCENQNLKKTNFHNA